MEEQPALFNLPKPTPLTHWAEGPLVGFDLETTSPDPLTAHIVTYALVGEGFDVEVLIQPDGFEIPEEATAVHGITTEAATLNGLPQRVAMLMLHTSILQILRSGLPIVVYNAPYDLTILQRHLPGLNLADLRVIDPLLLDKQFDRYRKGSRKLADVCAHHGITLDNAHDARADVIGAVRLARALGEKHDELHATNILELQKLQPLWYRREAERFEKYLRDKKGQKDAVINRDWPIRKEALPAREV